MGRTLADFSSQTSRERSFTWGEGFARWRYRIDNSDARLRSFCVNGVSPPCSFSRSKQLNVGVTLYLSFDNDVLTVEEWWS